MSRDVMAKKTPGGHPTGTPLKNISGRSSRTSKYTKTFEEPEEETVIAPAIDYDTDIEEAQEKEINEYDTAATGIINYIL